jgi:hypothetical protein
MALPPPQAQPIATIATTARDQDIGILGVATAADGYMYPNYEAVDDYGSCGCLRVSLRGRSLLIRSNIHRPRSDVAFVVVYIN